MLFNLVDWSQKIRDNLHFSIIPSRLFKLIINKPDSGSYVCGDYIEIEMDKNGHT